MPAAAPHLRRRRDDLVQHVGRSADAADVFRRASVRLRRLVPFDAAAWLGTDPGTGLPTSPVRIDDLDGITQAMCAEHWQRELLVEDVNLFRHLARADAPAAALRRSLDDPAGSGRYRRFLRPLGFGDEMRTVLRVGRAPWGTITLWRREGRPPFTGRETAVLAGLAAPLGEALRRHARPAEALGEPVAHDRPGLLVFDDTGALAALVIEPAQPAAIAPIVLEAYDLSEREQQVIRLVARGAGTAEIAGELLVSRHTVRDHVKAIFAKVGVSSRGELVAKLFAEFYEPVHAADVTRAHAP